MSPSDASSLEYQERVVAFVDVLGFADLVKASAADAVAQDEVSTLIAVYKVFDWFTTEILEGIVDGSFFSDTFILSATPEQAFFLIRETGNLCRYLLLQGLPCRGAIATGQLHHRERIIIGPALVDAYLTEKSVAVYPRILVDDATMDYWTEECNSFHPRQKALVRKDFDGQNYLDILAPQWSESFLPWIDDTSSETVPPDPGEFLAAAFKRIRKGLTKSEDRPKVHAKYMWLATECQRHAAALGLPL